MAGNSTPCESIVAASDAALGREALLLFGEPCMEAGGNRLRAGKPRRPHRVQNRVAMAFAAARATQIVWCPNAPAAASPAARGGLLRKERAEQSAASAGRRSRRACDLPRPSSSSSTPSSSSWSNSLAWEKQPAERRKEGMRVEGGRRERERETEPESVNLMALSEGEGEGRKEGSAEQEGEGWNRGHVCPHSMDFKNFLAYSLAACPPLQLKPLDFVCQPPAPSPNPCIFLPFPRSHCPPMTVWECAGHNLPLLPLPCPSHPFFPLPY